MRQTTHLIMIFAILLVLASCGGKGSSVRHLPHLGNTPYQQDSILVAYGTNPERALTLLDSALLLGNISDYRSQFIRAKIYSKSLMEQHQDSAVLILKSLLTHDSVRNNATEQINIFDMLITNSRIKQDFESYLHWATQKAELCKQQSKGQQGGNGTSGMETERWRTEADIGLVMTQLGQVDKGLHKIDEAISRLDAPGSIDRMDAFIIAVKRKINALNFQHRNAEIIPQAQRILDRLNHYEQHAKDYAEDSYRLSWSDHPNDRDRYLDFSRAQAWGFMAQAYANIDSLQEARKYLALFDQSGYGKTFMARRMIAPTQMALGMYDEALATYDELERYMATDTLNDDYAVILRSRAIAARAKGHLVEALDYQTRYANLSKAVSDSLHVSEAHQYAARYHDQEQKMEIQEKEAEVERSHIVSMAVAFLALLAITFACYFFRQKHIVSEKNRVLVRMINELQMSKDAQTTPNGQSSIFNSIDTAIRSERLYSNIGLQRQDICNRFGISRHTLNDLLSEHTGGLSFPQYVNTIRLEEVLRLLRDEPAKTLSSIASEVGFTPANLREQFKRRYGMTPGEYQKQQAKV